MTPSASGGISAHGIHPGGLKVREAQAERQSSSGLVVATGLGSIAWFKSIVTGSLVHANRAAASFFRLNYNMPLSCLIWDRRRN